MQLLRLNKDATTTKLSLALFTRDLADNKDLGARVAHLEAELAGVALTSGRREEALHALVAAAAAYRVLGDLLQARSCLERAASLRVGDGETRALLASALTDLDKTLYPPQAAKPKPAFKPAPEAETVEVEASKVEAAEAETVEVEAPKVEAAEAETKKAPKKNSKRGAKKRAPKPAPLP